jgi:hypothetical protein
VVIAHAAASGWTTNDSLTLFLGIATLILGAVAAYGNHLTRRGLKVSQAELKASILPLLEAVPEVLGTGGAFELIDFTNVGGDSLERQLTAPDRVRTIGADHVYCSIPIHNVGPGIARIGPAKPRALSVPDVKWTEGECTRPLIPAGESARLHFPLFGTRDEIYAEAFYRDMAGEQGTRIRLYLTREESTPNGDIVYSVAGTALYEEGSDSPYAISGDSRVARTQPSPRPATASLPSSAV